MAITPNGVTAFIRSYQGDVMIEPYANGQNIYHLVYYTKEADSVMSDLPALTCGYQNP